MKLRDAVLDHREMAAFERVVDSTEAANSRPSAVRVCVVISSYRPVVGGAEKATERLCSELCAQGLKVVVVTRRYRGLSREDVYGGVSVLRLGHQADKGKVGALSFAIHSLWTLVTKLRSYRAVHVQSPDTPLLIGFVAKLLFGRRLLATLQSDPDIIMSGRTGRLRWKLMGRISDAVGAQTPRMRRQLVSGGIPEGRVHLLPNSVDTSRFRPATAEERAGARARLGLSRDAHIYLFVGRLVGLKRVDLLLRAWARLASRERTLIVLGDGLLREELGRLRVNLGLGDVRFDPVTEDVLTYLQAADIFVLPSQLEGLSNALLEAMATGLTPVVSDLPANRTLVRHGVNGLVFPVDDLDALTECLTTAGLEELRARLGAAAVRTVRDQYSLKVIAARHYRLYADVAKG